MGATEPATVTCGQCLRAFRWKLELAGKKAKCKCGGRVDFPSAEPSQATQKELVSNDPGTLATRPASARTSPAIAGPVRQTESNDDLLALTPAEPSAPARPRVAATSSNAFSQAVCPTCSSPTAAQAVLCLRCGTNLRTGAKIKTAVKGPGVDAGDVAKKAGKVVLSLVLGGITAVVCAVLWIVIIVLTHLTIGFMAVGVGLATGGVIRLVNPSGNTISGFAAAGFALFSLALVKAVLMFAAARVGIPLFAVFSLFDILWTFLAVSSAFKLGAGLN